MNHPTLIVLIFAAGGLGTLARYGLNLLAGSVFPQDFPFGTTVINALGCLLFGIALGLVQGEVLAKEHAPIVLVGFLGAFTTFSTFAAEAHVLLENSRWLPFAVYLAAQNILGLICVRAGLAVTS